MSKLQRQAGRLPQQSWHALLRTGKHAIFRHMRQEILGRRPRLLASQIRRSVGKSQESPVKLGWPSDDVVENKGLAISRKPACDDTALMRIRPMRAWPLVFLLAHVLTLRIHAASLVLSEFMASNHHTLADGNGNFPDWIEIYNSGDL